MAEEIALQITLDATKAAKTIGGLEDGIDTLKEELRGLEIGTQEFNKVARAISDAEARVKDFELRFESLDFEQRLTAGIDVATGIAGGFAAAEGAMALFGEESEALEQTLVKVTAAFSLVSGLREIGNGIAAFRKLGGAAKAYGVIQRVVNTIMSANPVLLLVAGFVALGAAIAGAAKFFKSLSAEAQRAAAKQAAFNEVSKQAAESVAEELNALDKLSKTLKDNEGNREGQVEAVKALQEEYPDLLANVDAEADSIDKVNEAIKLNGELLLERAKLEAIAALRAEQFKEAINTQVEAQTEQNVGWIAWATGLTGAVDAQEVANAQSAESIAANQEQISVLDELNGEIEANIAALEEQGAAIGQTSAASTLRNQLLQGQVKALEETEKKAAEARRKREEERRKAAEQRLKDEQRIADERRKIIKSFQDQEELESLRVGEEQEKSLALQQESADQEVNIFALASQQIVELERQKQEELRKAAEEADARRQDQLNKAQNGINFLSDLNESFVKDEQKREKIRKALALAQIAVDTARAVSAAIAAGAGIPFPGNIPAILSGVTAVLSGIAQAKALLGEAGGTDVGAIAQGAAQGANGGGPDAPLNTFSTGVDRDRQELTQRVVVVESDITNTQNTVAQVQQQATF